MARFLAVLGEYRQAPDVVRTRLYYEMYDQVFGGADGHRPHRQEPEELPPAEEHGRTGRSRRRSPAPATRGARGAGRHAMKKTIIILVIIGAALLIISLLGPYYILVEGEQAVVVQFGRIVRVDTQAGVHYKVPFVENVVKYSKKVQSWDGDAQRIPTSENQFIWVDTTARWRISDPKKFYESVGSMTQAQGRHGRRDRLRGAEGHLQEPAARGGAGLQRHQPDQADQLPGQRRRAPKSSGAEQHLRAGGEPVRQCRSGRRALSLQMRDEARTIMPQYGMELIDVLIRQIKYSDDLTQSVYDRMIKERNQIAQAFRSDGEGEKAKWLGQTTQQAQADPVRRGAQGQGDQGQGGRRGAGHPQPGVQPGPGVRRLLDGAGGVQDHSSEVQQDDDARRPISTSTCTTGGGGKARTSGVDFRRER